MIITTGGASVGEADYVKEILDRCGEVNFWKIAIKPGKPLAFGKIGSCCFFGLPGNPVAVIVTFQYIVAPALKQLSGAPDSKPLQLTATCTTALKKVARTTRISARHPHPRPQRRIFCRIIGKARFQYTQFYEPG